jgi:hypothetical protein
MQATTAARRTSGIDRRPGQQHRRLVGDRRRQLVGGQVGERQPGELRLDPVDEVPEDPPAAVATLAVAALPAVPAGTACGDAGGQHPVTGASPLTPEPTLTTVPTASWPTIRPGCTAGTSPPTMCRSVPQIVTASTSMIASRGSVMAGSGTSVKDF